ncbi:MAG: NAD(P)H-dependent oxidoreductase [Phycisphaerae bacterium]|nr:NAD(P)H-dependent oxidoreductase [Phycisphaerae bacterium]
MFTTSPDALIERLLWRYAVKKFDPAKKIPEASWAALERAMVLAPSSYGLQPWRFVVVTTPAVRARLREASWGQPQITDASHLVVFARKVEVTVADVDAYVRRIAEVRAVPGQSLDEYRGMMTRSVGAPAGLPGGSMETWTRSQVYIALGVFLTSAAMLGIDACPMEGFVPAPYDEILGLRAQGFAAVVVATAGYRGADDALASMPKVRARHEDVVRRV